MPSVTWTLESLGERPWTVNAERRMNLYERARRVRNLRTEFGWLAQAKGVPPCEWVTVVVTPLAKDRRWIQDVAGCAPAAKAAVDGLVDAGVLLDDSGKFFRAVTFLPVEVGEIDGLRLDVTGQPI